MKDDRLLADSFEAHRGHMRSVAYRMLGSVSEADDAVQGTWLRLSGSDPDRIENLGGWLTIAVARECLDMLRATRSQPFSIGHPTRSESSPAGHAGGSREQ